MEINNYTKPKWTIIPFANEDLVINLTTSGWDPELEIIDEE